MAKKKVKRKKSITLRKVKRVSHSKKARKPKYNGRAASNKQKNSKVSKLKRLAGIRRAREARRKKWWQVWK